MLVDPAGIAAAAARLTEALAGVTGDAVHPPLGADPASAGAAQRLSTAATALAGSLSAQLAALVTTAETLGLTSAGYVATDAANAATLARLGGGGGGPASAGSAPPAPTLAPDVRAPLPPPPAPSGQAISVAVHAGDPAAGEGFSSSWSRVATAAGDAADTVRSVVGRLPDMLDTTHATPAVTAHLNGYADAFDAAGRRAGDLARQAVAHADLRSLAGQQIPTPTEIADATTRWQQTAMANIRSRGALAVQTAQAEADLRALETKAVTSYASYHTGTDAATGGEETPTEDGRDPARTPGPGQPGTGEDPAATADPHAAPGTGAAGPGTPEAAAAAGATSPEGMGQMASMLPQMIPTVLGAAGGLLGGLTKVPETLMQGGMQAMQGLTGMMAQKPETSTGIERPTLDDPSVGEPGLGGAGAGGGGEVTPASGGPATLPGTTTPSTGPPPTPPSIPAGGALPPPVAPAGGTGGGAMPMGMPMGAMGGAPGGGAGARGDEPGQKKVVTPPLPHTEAVTGKVSADRMAVSAARPAERDDPHDDDPFDDDPTAPRSPVVRRITMPRRDEP